MLLIAGTAKAVEVLMPDIKQRFEKVTDLRSYLLQKLSSLDGIAINSDENCLPYIVNISLIGYRSEIILHYLEDKGIYIYIKWFSLFKRCKEWGAYGVWDFAGACGQCFEDKFLC